MKADVRCFCGSRKPHNICHPDVSVDSKYANVTKAYFIIDKFCKNNRVQNLCNKNCCECCSDYFYVSENEFLIILDYIERKNLNLDRYYSKATALLEKFRIAYPREYKKLESLMPTFKGAFSYKKIMKYYDDSAVCSTDNCIFLENGVCSIYEVRPLMCRGYGSIFPCKIIMNKDLRADFFNFDAIVNSIQRIATDEKILLKRDYPLFYWFAKFLSEKYRETTYIKLDKFKTLSEKNYQVFSIEK